MRQSLIFERFRALGEESENGCPIVAIQFRIMRPRNSSINCINITK
jgi:hypothetical protein